MQNLSYNCRKSMRINLFINKNKSKSDISIDNVNKNY